MDKAVGLVIKVTSDARGATAGIDGATQKVSKLGQAGKVAGRLLAAGLLVAAGAAIKFTQAAAEDAQAQSQLAQTAQQAAGATKAQTAAMEDWITAQGLAKGVADDELRPAMSKLITATKDVGKAQALASLAMDISARSGKSLDSVAQSLAKAQNGSAAGLGKYGVATKDAAGKAKSLADIQADLATKYKGAADAAAQTDAGKAKVLAVQYGELQEKIGTGLLPVMGKLVTVGLQVVDWISQNQKAAAAIVITIGSLLAIIKAVSLATEAYTAIQTILNVVMAANPVVLIVLALVALAAAFIVAYKKSETFRNIVNAAFDGISKVVGATVDFIREHWRVIITILGGPIGLAVALITKHWDTIKAGAGVVIDWVREKWPVIKAIVTAPFENAKKVIDGIWDKISSAFDTAKGVIEKTAGGVRDAIVGPFNAARDAIQAVIDKIQAAIDKLREFAGMDKGSGVKGNPGTGSRLAGRSLDGRLSTGATERPLAVHLHLEGHTFVGDEAKLGRELKRLFGDELRRVGMVV